MCFYSFTQNPVEGGQQTLIAAHNGIEVSRQDGACLRVAQGAVVSSCAVYIPARREIPAGLRSRRQFHPKSLLSLCNTQAHKRTQGQRNEMWQWQWKGIMKSCYKPTNACVGNKIRITDNQCCKLDLATFQALLATFFFS